jgi:homospermidine synthase
VVIPFPNAANERRISIVSEALVDFNKRVLMVGYGSVAQCTLPILVKHLRVPLKNITVLDFEDQARLLEPFTSQGVRFVRQRITPDKLGAVLGQYLGAGDLLIDLAWNIECGEILTWCHDRGVLYINTSVEVWDPYDRALYSHPTQRTLYWRHQNLSRLRAGWSERGPTAILEHGANPGLISHFTKQALLDIGQHLLAEKKVTDAAAEELSQLMADRTFNRLAMNLGVRVIHCSERDTQICDRP